MSRVGFCFRRVWIVFSEAREGVEDRYLSMPLIRGIFRWGICLGWVGLCTYAT